MIASLTKHSGRLTDLDNLPDPDVPAEESIENLETGLECFWSNLDKLK